MITHCIPYYARENGPKRQAICGRWVLPKHHAHEPTCKDCVVLLVKHPELRDGEP